MITGCGKENITAEPATDVEQQIDTEVSGEENVQEAETTEEVQENETTENAQENENNEETQESEKTEETSDKQDDKSYTAEDISNAIDPAHLGVEFEQDGFKIKMFASGQDMMLNYGYFVPVDKIETLVESEGIPYDMDKVKANGGLFLEFSLYSVGGDVYCYTNIEGTDKYTKIPATGETQGLFSKVSSTEKTGINPENLKEVKYIETKTYDGTIVDVVEFTSVDSNSTLINGDFLGGNNSLSDNNEKKVNMYIDVETGKAIAISAIEGGTEYIINLFEADVELPSEYANAEQGTYDDLLGQMMGFMFLPFSFGSDQNAGF